ncbi:MFS transporter [Candidatus Poriferisodalis sp.]|uniref:MFS transporter n=1 Tax=Candidatus Poriferisodalis sp. TaxID=3101277 RepID=UPI003B02ABA9
MTAKVQREWRRALLYLGGLMGPLGTFVLLPMFPELRSTYGVTTAQLGWALWCYLLPFSGFLLVSGTLGDRWGRSRVLRLAIALYAAATAGCALAPSYAVFLSARVAQGALNAFITPLLLATLTDAAPASGIGRIVGRYSAGQALGQLGAPLLGGLSADVNWRLGFVATAVIGAVIAALLPSIADARSGASGGAPGGTSVGASAPDRTQGAVRQLRSLLRRPMLLLAATTLLSAFGPVGVVVLVGLSSRDVIGLSGLGAGLLLLGGAAAGMAAAPMWGVVLDRWGGRNAAAAAVAASSALVVMLPAARSAWMLAVVWCLAGAAAQMVVVSLQSLASVAAPQNRAGALSFTLSHRFAGHAVGSVVWLPVFAFSPTAAYLASAAVGVLALGTVAASGLDTVVRSVANDTPS